MSNNQFNIVPLNDNLTDINVYMADGVTLVGTLANQSNYLEAYIFKL